MTPIRCMSAIALAAIAAGCHSTTVQGRGDLRITIVRPSDQSIRPGEINKVAIVVTRSGFRTDIRVRFAGLPKGVRVIETDRNFSEDDIVVSFTLHAANDAPPVEEALVKVTAEGPEGLAATETFRVTVRSAHSGMR